MNGADKSESGTQYRLSGEVGAQSAVPASRVRNSIVKKLQRRYNLLDIKIKNDKSPFEFKICSTINHLNSKSIMTVNSQMLIEPTLFFRIKSYLLPPFRALYLLAEILRSIRLYQGL